MTFVFLPYYCFFSFEEIFEQTFNFDSASKTLLTSGNFFPTIFFITVSESISSNRSIDNVHRIFKFKYIFYKLVLGINITFNS